MSTTEAPKPVATIGNPSETVGLDTSGKAVEGLRVPFTTAKGIEGFVFLPGRRVHHEAIVAAVRERAVALDSVAGHEVI
jgi:hypothetical protein